MKRLNIALTAGLLLGLAAAAVAQVLSGEPFVTSYTVIVEQQVAAAVRVGQTISINGQNFGVQPGAVQIGCTDVEPATWSPTRITFTVPPMEPTTRPVQLTIFTENPKSYYRALAFSIVP